MSAGVIVTNEPSASRWTAQMTRLVATLHGCPDWNDAGLEAASRAPARAALSMAIVAWKRRAMSAAATSRSSNDGQDQDEFDRRLAARSSASVHPGHAPHHPITPPMGPARSDGDGDGDGEAEGDAVGAGVTAGPKPDG